jgi:hypothetical protein
MLMAVYGSLMGESNGAVWTLAAHRVRMNEGFAHIGASSQKLTSPKPSIIMALSVPRLEQIQNLVSVTDTDRGRALRQSR